MSHPENPKMLATSQRIDAVRVRFESDIKAGGTPRIEDWLASTTGAARVELLRALVRAELDLLPKMPKEESYRARFPQEAAVIKSVFQEALTRTRDGIPGGTSDTSIAGKKAAGPAPAPTLPLPQRIGRFEVLSLLGEGAFGKVFKARDPQLDREVAIKVPSRGALQTEKEVERFLREARAAATIQHPNICPVYEVNQQDNQFYIVMAFVAGKSLAAMLKERKEPLAAKQAALIVRKIALALDVAHAKGVIHRDLKPANIMMDKERKDVVIMDFGLARRQKHDDARLTQEGAIMGTPAYMAPEQARGEVEKVGPVADLYSLGVILYEMLAGQLPFRGSMTEVLAKVLMIEPEPPSVHRAGLDRRLEAICLKAMAKDPTARYGSMREFAEALNDWLKTAEAAPVPPPLPVAMPVTVAPARPSVQVSDVAANLSAQRREATATTIEAAIARARVPLWQILLGSALVGFVLLAGILFFARTPTTMVLVQIDVNLNDPSLSFILDGKDVSAETLGKPIELKVGQHELLVHRGGETIRSYRFKVTKGAEPKIELKEKAGPSSPDPEAKPEPNTKDGFVSLFNGNDFTGWQVHGKTQAWEINKAERALVAKEAKPASLLQTERDYGDFHLRLEFRVAAKNATGGVNIRMPASPQNWQQLKIQIRDDSTPYNNSQTGGICWKNDGATHIKREREDLCNPFGEWNQMEVIAQGASVRVVVNGKQALAADLSEYAAEPLAHSGVTLRTGRIALNAYRGDVWYRNVEIKELSVSAPLAADEGFTSLFDGKGLVGWTGDPTCWRAEKGEIVGGSRGAKIAKNLFLRLDKKYGDFELRLEAKMTAGNSGIQVRSWYTDAHNFTTMLGPQVEISHTKAWPWGSLVTEPAGNPALKADPDAVEKALKPNDFNAMVIRCAGKHITIKLNDVTTVDDDFPTMPEDGLIGLQVHKGHPDMEVRFRNIRIKDLKPGTASGFVPLFNGKDLSGWRTFTGAPNNWRVENGLLTCSGVRSHLFSEQAHYLDFHFLVEARINEGGNSGQYFRTEFGPDHPKGYEAQIVNGDKGDPQKTGSLYNFVRIQNKLVDPDVWFTQEVIARGKRIIIKVNGKEIVDFTDENNTYRRGHFALQHNNPQTKVEFRRVEVKELK